MTSHMSSNKPKKFKDEVAPKAFESSIYNKLANTESFVKIDNDTSTKQSFRQGEVLFGVFPSIEGAS